MTPKQFDQLVERAVNTRESGHLKDAELAFISLETIAREMGDAARELSTRGQRLVCYLHLVEAGESLYLAKLHDEAREGIRSSLKVRGNPEIRTFRYRFAQALFLMGKHKAAYKQVTMSIRGLHRKDAQYFQFLPLRALISHHLAKDEYVSAQQDLSDALMALDDWEWDHQYEPHAERTALIHKTGILMKLVEIHLVNKLEVDSAEEAKRIDKEARLAASGLIKMVRRLATEFEYPLRQQQWIKLKKKYRKRKTTKK